MPLDLSSPVVVNSVWYRHHQSRTRKPTQLTLQAESFECFDLRIARSEIRRIELGNSKEADRLVVTMFFDHPLNFASTEFRKRTDHITLTVDPPTALLLRSYVKQTPPVKNRLVIDISQR